MYHTHRGVVGLVGIVLAAATLFGAQNQQKSVAGKGHAAMMSDCAKACADCQRECDICSTHCAMLVSEGKKAHLKTLMTCQDCASFCTSAAQIVSRNGPMADIICKSCADACARCGEECARFPDDQHMKRCADECRKCEKACREMLKHTQK